MADKTELDATCELLLDFVRRNPEAAALAGRRLAAAGVSCDEAAAGFARMGHALANSTQLPPALSDKA